MVRFLSVVLLACALMSAPCSFSAENLIVAPKPFSPNNDHHSR